MSLVEGSPLAVLSAQSHMHGRVLVILEKRLGDPCADLQLLVGFLNGGTRTRDTCLVDVHLGTISRVRCAQLRSWAAAINRGDAAHVQRVQRKNKEEGKTTS